MNLRDELLRVLDGDASPLIVSRAASPAVRRICADRSPVLEAPVVRGRTVWEACPDGLLVIETPNWWGRLEETPEERRHCVVDRRNDAVGHGPLSLESSPDWTARIAAVRHCLRTAMQLRGVGAAHGDPEAPWAILLLPVAAQLVEARCEADGVEGVAALRPRVPELPGGLRIEARDAAPGEAPGFEWGAAVVASIRHVMKRSGAQ